MTNESFIKCLDILQSAIKNADSEVMSQLTEHAKKLVAVADQVDALLSMAKRISGKTVDDGDIWQISDDVFQEVQKAFDEIKTASAKELD